MLKDSGDSYLKLSGDSYLKLSGGTEPPVKQHSPVKLAILSLKRLLAERGNEGCMSEDQHFVNLEQFGALLNWIGPIHDPTSKHNFMQRICLLFQNR